MIVIKSIYHYIYTNLSGAQSSHTTGHKVTRTHPPHGSPRGPDWFLLVAAAFLFCSVLTRSSILLSSYLLQGSGCGGSGADWW